MTLTIDAKYNIGDIVYVAYCYHDYWPLSTPCTVKNILFHGDIGSTHIFYEVKQDLFVDHVPEGWLFPTYAECAKWCEKHNKI